MADYRLYVVEVHFKNGGEVYGRETYRTMATNEDQANAKALKNATGSQYDDDRIPDRKVYVHSCELADEVDA